MGEPLRVLLRRHVHLARLLRRAGRHHRDEHERDDPTDRGRPNGGASYFAEYCQPNCTNPNASANLTLRAWQQLTAFVNLTTAATVYESSTGGSTVIGVAALGIDNASSSARGQLNESYSIMRGTHAGAHGSLGVTHRASMGVQFSPGVGLFPWNASAGQSWNATSAFTAQGGWNDSYTYVDTLRGITSSSSGSSSGSVSQLRNESVPRARTSNITLKNGMMPTIVVIGYLGTVRVRRRVVPDGGCQSDVFGGASTGSERPFVRGRPGFDLGRRHRRGSATHSAVTAAARPPRGSAAAPSGRRPSRAPAGLSLQPQTPPSANESVQDQPESRKPPSRRASAS